MVVITVTNCPAALRGALSKWFMEISVGTYVGNVSARVRDELWESIQNGIKTGKAVMVFNAQNEQRMDFKVHNSDWVPVDYDGLKLIRHPTYNTESDLLKKGFSNASRKRKAEYFNIVNSKNNNESKAGDTYIVLDLETTGLKPDSDKIIEIGAILVRNEEICRTYNKLVKVDTALPDFIVELTGLTNRQLNIEGIDEKDAIQGLIDFVENKQVVGYNIGFDIDFLREACERNNLTAFENKSIDVLKTAKKKVFEVSNYKLDTLLNYFEINSNARHHAVDDCIITMKLFEKLKKL
jgi:CRISPR-associated endoribonuclease Cas2, subtype I-E/ECOLI